MKNSVKLLIFIFFVSLIIKTGSLKAQPLENRGHEVVIIDKDLPHLHVLLKGIPSGSRLIYLDKSMDLLSGIDKIIRENAPIASLHVLTHGKPGTLIFSDTKINTDVIEQNVKPLSRWKQYFMGSGDILLYGCEIGKGTEGMYFVNVLSSITGLDIAASDNLTGSNSKGGDWNFEMHIGQIEVSAIISDGVRSRYPVVFSNR